MTITAQSALAGMRPAGTIDRSQTSRDFEAVFAGQLAQLLLEQVDVDAAFGGGHGEEMFRGVLGEELGKAISKTGMLGIAPAVLAQMQKLEEGPR